MSQLTSDYFRQIGVRTDWRAGDVAYRKGQMVTVVKVVHDSSPAYVVVRTPDGAEVGTEFCYLSELPTGGAFRAPSPVGTSTTRAPTPPSGARGVPGRPPRNPAVAGNAPVSGCPWGTPSLPELCLVSPSTAAMGGGSVAVAQHAPAAYSKVGRSSSNPDLNTRSN